MVHLLISFIIAGGMMDNHGRYQIWYERRMIKKYYNSYHTLDEANKEMMNLIRQYPRSWRFYIIETETFSRIRKDDEIEQE